MRNLVIDRITVILNENLELQDDFNISPDKLQHLSNEELLDLLEDLNDCF